MRYYSNYVLRHALVKVMRLSEWQDTALVDKKYACCTLAMVNELLKKEKYQNGSIVEVGCGLGDIIGNIDTNYIKKIGLDINNRIVIASRILYLNKKNNHFIHGGFERIRLFDNIHILIMVNVLHIIHPNDVKEGLRCVLSSQGIDYIIMDEIRGDISHYQYEQNGEQILNEFGYEKEYVSRKLKAAGSAYRTINVYKYIVQGDDK